MKPSELKAAVRDVLSGTSYVPLIQGAPGVGKSQLARQIAGAMEMRFIDVRASLYDNVDLRGFPWPDAEHGRMSTLRPDFLPPADDDTPTLIFFDEITAIQDRSVQVALYQLILDHQIGEHKLHPAWKKAAAGNFTSGADGGFGTRMSSALRRRFWWLRFDVDLNDWCAWAIDAGMPYELVAFQRLRGEGTDGLLHKYDPDSADDNFPCPATWEQVGHYTNAHLSNSASSGPGVYSHLEMLSGIVGKGAAAEYLGFLKIAREIESPDRIIADPDGAKVSANPAVLYAQVGALAKRSTQTTFGNIMKYADRIPGDFRTLLVRDAIHIESSVQHTPAFVAWAQQNQGAII